MFGKGSKIYAITTGCCPKCNEESMYKDTNPFHLSKIYEMHEKCSHCGLTYSIEPSFFYGAMYVSYALGVAFSVAAFIVSYVFFKTNLKTAFIAIVVTLIVMMPIMMRLSRNIWISFFVSYDEKWKEKLSK